MDTLQSELRKHGYSGSVKVVQDHQAFRNARDKAPSPVYCWPSSKAPGSLSLCVDGQQTRFAQVPDAIDFLKKNRVPSDAKLIRQQEHLLRTHKPTLEPFIQVVTGSSRSGNRSSNTDPFSVTIAASRQSPGELSLRINDQPPVRFRSIEDVNTYCEQLGLPFCTTARRQLAILVARYLPGEIEVVESPDHARGRGPGPFLWQSRSHPGQLTVGMPRRHDPNHMRMQRFDTLQAVALFLRQPAQKA